MKLSEKHCVPCRGGIPPLSPAEVEGYLDQVKGWSHREHHDIGKTFTFPDFASALRFANRIGEVAESEGHHPDLLVAWGKVGVTIWTHKINGLTESDFVLAARIDELPRS